MLSIGQRRMRERVDFDDPKEFDDPQIFDYPKGISIGSMDFDNPKVYSDTSIFDGLVETFSSEFLWCKSLGVLEPSTVWASVP